MDTGVSSKLVFQEESSTPRKHESTKTSNVYDILLVLQGDIFNREVREVRET
jgi:hypothetical protein